MCNMITMKKDNQTLDKWMSAKCMTNDDAAEVLETTPATISRVRRGLQWPSRALAQRIADKSKGRITLEGLLQPGQKGAS